MYTAEPNASNLHACRRTYLEIVGLLSGGHAHLGMGSRRRTCTKLLKPAVGYFACLFNRDLERCRDTKPWQVESKQKLASTLSCLSVQSKPATMYKHIGDPQYHTYFLMYKE